MIDVVKSKNSLDRSQKLKNWFDMKKLWIMCLSLFAIVLSSGASHAGLSLDRCIPFFAVSYHGNIDTDFNETHPGVKCDWDEKKPSLLFGITYKLNSRMMIYGAPTGFQGDYIIGMEISLYE
jgi:hypothetical protein